MKSAVFFASVVAAEYGYLASPSSSANSAYTTVNPGCSKEPITVTSQYQPVSTCSVPAYQTTPSCSTYAWVSTVLSDYEGHKYTVTSTNQPVTVYHTKSTITHTSTEYGYAAPTGYPLKNSTHKHPHTKVWYELYEKSYEVPYDHLGPKALPGYPGSGLCHEDCYGEDDTQYQPVTVKEHTGGKYNTYAHTFTYGAPKPSVTTYATPGTYTISAYDATLEHPTNVPAAATTTCHAHEQVTYGGVTYTAAAPTTVTVPYGAYETHGHSTKNIVKYKTVTCPHAGKYTVIKPTTTSYDHDTTVTYPTHISYPAGVYHHTKETVTVTKSNQPYTCHYQSSSTYSSTAYPTSVYSSNNAYPTSIYSSNNAYPTSTPSTTTPYQPDVSSYNEEPVENYGTPYAGYVKRGGMLERRKAEPEVKKPVGKRVILV